ncbi:MAG: hypothetical protein ABI833_01515 [Acidobacteriota bacterium]
MIHLMESILNGVALFVGPLMLVGAVGGGLAMLQRFRDSWLIEAKPVERKSPGPLAIR